MKSYSKIKAIYRRPNDIILIILVLIIFLFFAVFASTTEISQLEKDIFNLINGISFNIGLPLTIVMFSGTIFGILIFVALAYFFKKKRLCFDLLLAGGLGGAFSELFKIIVARERPVALLAPIIREVSAVGFGFTSGHTTVVTAMAVIFTPYLKKKYRKFVWLFVLLIALGRIYLGVHFPVDVIGGYFLGLFVGLSIRLIRGTKGYKPSEKNRIKL
jgi:membrane-associated phospholipid phosphatase